jgi:hypothetical protein
MLDMFSKRYVSDNGSLPITRLDSGTFDPPLDTQSRLCGDRLC